MYYANCEILLNGKASDLVIALQSLKRNLKIQNDEVAESNRWHMAHSTSPRASRLMAGFEEYSSESMNKIQSEIERIGDEGDKEVSSELFPFFPLTQGTAGTDDIKTEALFMEAATAMRNGSMQLHMDWDGPGDNHSIIWTLDKGSLKTEYYDWVAEWGEAAREKINYRWKDNQWVLLKNAISEKAGSLPD